MDAIDKSFEFTESEAEFRRKIWLVLAPLYGTTPDGAIDDGLCSQSNEAQKDSSCKRTDDDEDAPTYFNAKHPRPATKHHIITPGMNTYPKDENQTNKTVKIKTDKSKHGKRYNPPTEMSREELSKWRTEERRKRKNEYARLTRKPKTRQRITSKHAKVYNPPTEMSKEELSQWRVVERNKRNRERGRIRRSAEKKMRRELENTKKGTLKHAKVYNPPTEMSKEELSQWRADERKREWERIKSAYPSTELSAKTH